MISNRSIVSLISGIAHVLEYVNEQVNEDDVYLSYLPLAHILDRVIEEFFIFSGASIGFWRGAITATGAKKNDFIFGEVQSQLKNKNITVDVKASSASASNLFTTVTVDELATPGLKTIFSFVVPDQRSGESSIATPSSSLLH